MFDSYSNVPSAGSKYMGIKICFCAHAHTYMYILSKRYLILMHQSVSGTIMYNIIYFSKTWRLITSSRVFGRVGETLL